MKMGIKMKMMSRREEKEEGLTGEDAKEHNAPIDVCVCV